MFSSRKRSRDWSVTNWGKDMVTEKISQESEEKDPPGSERGCLRRRFQKFMFLAIHTKKVF